MQAPVPDGRPSGQAAKGVGGVREPVSCHAFRRRSGDGRGDKCDVRDGDRGSDGDGASFAKFHETASSRSIRDMRTCGEASPTLAPVKDKNQRNYKKYNKMSV
jgi:hypothetical protein